MKQVGIFSSLLTIGLLSLPGRCELAQTWATGACVLHVTQEGEEANTQVDDSAFSAYHFTAAQKEAIKALLSKAEGWRLALPSDNHSADLKQFEMEHPGYTPYYVQADITGDGRKDFVIALVRGKYFGVVFLRAKGDHYSSPQWLTRKGALRDGGLFVDARGVWGGQFYTDNLFLFVWSKKLHKLVSQ